MRLVEIDLERHGVDPVHIRLPDTHPTTGEQRNRVDDATARWAASRAVVGTSIGAIVGAAVFLVVSFAFVDTVGSVGLFALGGAIFGATVGFFYGFALTTPASAEVFDTFSGVEVDRPQATEHWISVEGSDSLLETAASVMEHHQPDRLVTS